MSLLGGGGVCILTHVLGGLAVACGGIVTPCALSHLWFLNYNDKIHWPSGYSLTLLALTYFIEEDGDQPY